MRRYISATELLIEPVVVRSWAMGPTTAGRRTEASVNFAGRGDLDSVWFETKSQAARSARVLEAQ